jgi:hypothetical protein
MRGGRTRLPRRCTDRVEDAVAWLLTALGLLTAMWALVAGVRQYGDEMRRVRLDAGERWQVQAVLVEPVPGGVPGGMWGRAANGLPIAVPVRYSGPDGVEHVTEARIPGPLSAGTQVPIWLDRAGTVVAAPKGHVDIVWTAGLAALALVSTGTFVLGSVWAGVSGYIRRLNAARWQREWEQVEPGWSGRTQR